MMMMISMIMLRAAHESTEICRRPRFPLKLGGYMLLSRSRILLRAKTGLMRKRQSSLRP